MILVLAAVLLFQTVDYSAEGMKAMDARQFDTAAGLFTKAIAQDQKDFTAHFNLALALSILKKDSDAIPEYEKTLELKPGIYQAQLNLGMLLLRNQLAPRAVPLLEAAVAQKPKGIQPNFNLATAYLAAGQPAKAEETFQTVLALSPGDANAELGLARAMGAQNRLAEAVPHFHKAAELDPKLRNGLLDLAQLYESANQPTEAIAIYQQFPQIAAAQARLGELLVNSKNYAEAIPRLEKAVADLPTTANRLALADAYKMNKEPLKEMDQLSKAAAAAPRDYDLRMTLGRTLRDQKKLVPASQEFLAAAQIKPESVPAWNELASALINSENYTQGLAALDRIRALGKETPGNLFYRAITLDKLRQLKPAVESYEAFLAADNNAHPDQEFQARQRARIIRLELSKR